MADAKPYPKAAQLARGERRYRRRVASPKQWQAIIEAKRGPCRCCNSPTTFSAVQLHHVVSREDHGDDLPENIVPLCVYCHDAVTKRGPMTCRLLLASLTDAEYAYMIERGGEDYPERAYGIRYER